MDWRLLLGLLYLGAACGFYSYLIRTAQILPEEMVEATFRRGRSLS
jgi:hypothetical protein